MAPVDLEVPLIDLNALLVERDEINAGVVQQLKTALAQKATQYAKLLETTQKLEAALEKSKGDPNKIRLKLGVAHFFLGNITKAIHYLEAVATPLARFYTGLSHLEQNRPDEALQALEAAGKAGYAAAEVKLQKAGALRRLNRLEEARETLESIEEYLRNGAEYLYQMGELFQAQGDRHTAANYFTQALASDRYHPEALFQLALYHDREGNDFDAIDLYERCLLHPPVRLGVLINLGILYEDHHRYDQAIYCYNKVLDVDSNHSRAKLFLRDSLASREQVVDEDIEQRNNQYNALLDRLVTDFELSVRSRNCLKRMNIRTLGDLTRVSESQLLNSKNFGETSLKEIKDMLHTHGLRLGQALEEKNRKQAQTPANEYTPEEQALLSKPISELHLSVRAKKCMQRLGINTIGELVSHTENELLECKNFGVTSLVEVREKLAAFNLKLRGT